MHYNFAHMTQVAAFALISRAVGYKPATAQEVDASAAPFKHRLQPCPKPEVKPIQDNFRRGLEKRVNDRLPATRRPSRSEFPCRARAISIGPVQTSAQRMRRAPGPARRAAQLRFFNRPVGIENQQ